MRVRSVGLLAVVTLVVASCGGGVPEAAGPSEGIQVHGDWTIDIYNEDGSLDRSVEFSNALTSGGSEHLARMLAGTRAPSGNWEINFKDQGGPSLCPSQTANCTFSGNPVTILNSEILQLSGSIVVEVDGEIDSVETWTYYCSVLVAPADCTVGTAPPVVFTFKPLSTPEPVSAGQTVQVQVDISFTTG